MIRVLPSVISRQLFESVTTNATLLPHSTLHIHSLAQGLVGVGEARRSPMKDSGRDPSVPVSGTSPRELRETRRTSPFWSFTVSLAGQSVRLTVLLKSTF